MGSRLSGQFGHRHGTKTLTSDLPCLDIRHFLTGSRIRPGSYCMGSGGDGTLFLDVHPNSIVVRASADVWRRMVQGISIETTGNRASLRRTWLCCPTLSCGRRVIALYFRDGFFCRRCLNLAYPSQSRSRIQRLFAQYARLEQRIGLVEGEPIRPKGMHRRTYEPLAARARTLHDSIYGPVERAMARVREADRAAAYARGGKAPHRRAVQ